MNSAIIPGSMQAIAAQSGKSLAETFLSCNVIILVDTSGSMTTNDSRGGHSRYQVACHELANLQNSLPGKIAVIGFSEHAQFFPSGQPLYFGGGTNMVKALNFAKIADVPGIRFILISDGWPDDPEETINIAKTYQNRIDTIYVGPESEREPQEFLRKLAQCSGGSQVTAERAQGLLEATQKLLLDGPKIRNP